MNPGMLSLFSKNVIKRSQHPIPQRDETGTACFAKPYAFPSGHLTMFRTAAAILRKLALLRLFFDDKAFALVF